MADATLSERNERLFGTSTPVAFVTGSVANRVGNVIATHFLMQGFTVVRHGRIPNGPPEVQGASETKPDGALSVVYGSIAEEDNVEGWRDEILRIHSRIDVVVNSAAIWRPIPLENTTSADFEEFFRVNALGTALIGKFFGLAMVDQVNGGCLINIGDWATARPYPDFSAYFASKYTVEGITRSLAVELATRNPHVRVNAILPGPVMLDTKIDDERRGRISASCLLKRDGSPEDVAHAAVFLATSPFITGVALPVDGGRTLYAGNTRDSVAHPDVIG